jgi:NTP pyrophosphatase (non-canonical NTP hydrolase)
MIELYNIYITTGNEEDGFSGARGNHGQSTQGAHLWIHNGDIKKRHSLDEMEINTELIVSMYGEGYHKTVPIKKIEMKDVYKEIQRINKLDPATPSLRLCKLFEEAGEFAQAVNKKLGRKVVTETEEEVIDLICEEAADTVQCLLSFADSYDLGFNFFEDQFLEGSHEPDGIYPERNLAKLFKYIGGVVYRWEKNHDELIFQFNACLSKVFSLTSYYGIKESEVIAKIAVKNIKWERVVNKRIEDGKVG